MTRELTVSQREGDLIPQRSWVSAQLALTGQSKLTSSVLMLTFSSGLAMVVRDHALGGGGRGMDGLGAT